MTTITAPADGEIGQGAAPDTARCRVGVVGLGYAGLPQAVAFARIGHPVLGVDADQRVVDALRAGRSPVDTVADVDVTRVGVRFRAQVGSGGLAQCSVVLLCVPTPLDADGRPDLRALRAAAATAARTLRPGQLIVTESTVHPGVTDEVVKPVLERSGLRAGVHFNLAFAPERVDPGNPSFGPTNTAKVVGGLTPMCARRAQELYQGVVPQVHVTKGLREAEAAKILENTYRQVNLALIHEFAMYCERRGIDVTATIDAAATKPFGFQPFYPGAGVGGHCIPVDPMYLAYSARESGTPLRMVELAQRINDGRPGQVVSQCRRLLEARGQTLSGARVLVLGLAYKPDVADVRNSPSIELIRTLVELGAQVEVHDPLVPGLTVDGTWWPSAPDLQAAVRSSDLVLLAQGHSAYEPATLAQAALVHIADRRQIRA